MCVYIISLMYYLCCVPVLACNVLCVHDFKLRLLLGSVCCRLKAAAAKLEEAIKSVTEEMEQYVELLRDN